jgi:hypothetical protein
MSPFMRTWREARAEDKGDNSFGSPNIITTNLGIVTVYKFNVEEMYDFMYWLKSHPDSPFPDNNLSNLQSATTFTDDSTGTPINITDFSYGNCLRESIKYGRLPTSEELRSYGNSLNPNNGTVSSSIKLAPYLCSLPYQFRTQYKGFLNVGSDGNIPKTDGKSTFLKYDWGYHEQDHGNAYIQTVDPNRISDAPNYCFYYKQQSTLFIQTAMEADIRDKTPAIPAILDTFSRNKQFWIRRSGSYDFACEEQLKLRLILQDFQDSFLLQIKKKFPMKI